MCVFAAPAVAGGLGAGATGLSTAALFSPAATLGIAAPTAFASAALPAAAFAAPTALAGAAIPATLGFGSAATSAGLFGLGAATNPFLASLGLNLATGLVQQQAATQAANAVYQSSLIANQSAEDAFRNMQDGLAERLKETKASKSQEKFAANIRALQQKGAIVASERAGLTIDVLLADNERQAANFRESINQTMESATRQYGRDVKGLIATRDNRRNQLQSNINQAYNQIPSLGSTLLNVATQGLSTYGQLAAL
tara:strand:- start:1405 stop:2169 length:765 start_codon:yes stop_codon:yes gene_type:complete